MTGTPAAGPNPWGDAPAFAVADPTACVGKRIGAYFIDYAILFVPTVALMLAVLVPGITELIEKAEDSAATGSTAGPPPELFAMYGKLFLVAGAQTVVTFLYHSVTEAVWSATPGKLMLGLRVVRADGTDPIGFGKAALRALLLVFVDMQVNGIVGLVLMLVTKGHKRLGDMVAKTYVVAKADVGRFTELWPPDGTPPWERPPGPMAYPGYHAIPGYPGATAPPQGWGQ